MNGPIAISLPHGIPVDGAFAREASVRELTGEDQRSLAEDCQELPSAAWTTEVLARCVTRLGATDCPDRAALRALTVGDREALLLHLHKLSFGDSIQCETRCPAEGCGEKLELELPVDQLLLPAYPLPGHEHELAVTGQSGNEVHVRFRLPTGDDHEAAARLARRGVDAGVAELLRRCVLSLDSAAMGTDVADALSVRMAELDPQAELLLNAGCPACGRGFRARLDVAAFLRQRFARHAQDLYREVHLLAFHYHWSERDILAMSSRHRQRYLRLLEAELSRGTLQ